MGRAGIGRAAAAALAACLLGGTPCFAQTVIKPLERPDPGTITVPDMTFAPTKSDIRRFDEYFYFHKPGVSYERAFADLDQCRIYGMVAIFGGLPPSVVPLGGPQMLDKPYDGPTMMTPFIGWLGDAIMRATIVADIMEGLARSTNRRCMMWKGYARHGATRALWKQIDTGSDAEKLARQAKLASGPIPSTQTLEP
ncbi:MAG TPA: hypothetical protein VN175_03935 [Rhizomicrobium sp.]|nr:hypothetical protein [Rhizomicrobium sp.]